MTSLQRAIVETICYFDLFDYPLTLAELERYLWQANSVSTVTLANTVAQLSTIIACTNGWLTLVGREQIIQTRHERYNASEQKWHKRLPYLRLLSFLPGVEAILIVNTLAYHNARPASDIDLLIITRPGKIWSTRFFTTLLAKLLRLRPRPGYTKDTLCLSFYLDRSQLDLNALNNGSADRHQAYWLAQAFPVYDPQQLATALLIANPWVKQRLPQTVPLQLHPYRTIRHTWLHHIVQSGLGLLAFEGLLKRLQLAILPRQLKQLHGPIQSAVVVLSDRLLKFHTYDPRPELTKRFQANLTLAYSR
ncbi:MAG: nucleotidyltransferase domain-containing protein [Candidatus Kerfeldbacteria bacterium]|nr:nucleotidyltransferase domain-containing protein [Candidatus Kerfeldbacteria bacterium]